jgi:hypothetical protein
LGGYCCKIARNIDPTRKVLHCIDVVGKDLELKGSSIASNRDPTQEVDSHKKSMRCFSLRGDRHWTRFDKQVLTPTLKPGDVVILDNLGSHKAAGVRNAIEASGATLVYSSTRSVGQAKAFSGDVLATLLVGSEVSHRPKRTKSSSTSSRRIRSCSNGRRRSCIGTIAHVDRLGSCRTLRRRSLDRLTVPSLGAQYRR